MGDNVPASSPVGTCEIIGASYGGSDVSEFLRDKYAAFKTAPGGAPGLSFVVSNAMFGFDPNPGVGKCCVIFYRVVLQAPQTSQPVWSRIQTVAAVEGHAITVTGNDLSDLAPHEPDPSTNQYIVSARYFNADVTAAVTVNYAAAYRSGQGTDLIVSPATMHIDPYPLSPKNLTVAYGNYVSPGLWKYSFSTGLGLASSWTLNIPAPFPVASSQSSSYNTSFVTFTNAGPVSPGFDIYPRAYDSTGFLVWDGQRHGFVIPSRKSRDLHLVSRIGLPAGTRYYFGFAYVRDETVVNNAYDATFCAVSSAPGTGSPATVTWNGASRNPVVSHDVSADTGPQRAMSYSPRDLRLIIRGASWGGANFTEFMKETYITSTIYNPPSDASNNFSFLSSPITLGSDPNPGLPKMFVLIYQVGYKVGETSGNIRISGIGTQGALDLSQYGSSSGIAVQAPAPNAPSGSGSVGPTTEQTDSFPIIDDIGSRYFYAYATEGNPININLLSLDTTPVLMTNSVSKSGPQPMNPDVFMAIWSKVDVTTKVKSLMNDQTPTSTAFANLPIGTKTLGPDPWLGVAKQLTMVYGYPTGDWRYTYRSKVLIHDDNSPLDFFRGPSTWNFLIEKILPEPQAELPVVVNPTARLQYDSEIMKNYLPGSSLQAASTAEEVQSYTINVQCFDANSLVLAGASVFVQSSSPTDVHLNGQPVSLSVSPIRCAFDATGDICIIASSTGLRTPTYTFSNLKDIHGNIISMPITTIDPSKKVLNQFTNIQSGNDLKNTTGRSGKTLYSGAAPPPDSDLNAAAKTFKDLSSASVTMPSTPPAVLTTLYNVAQHPLPNDGWPSTQSNKSTAITPAHQTERQAKTTVPISGHAHVQDKLSISRIGSALGEIVHQGGNLVDGLTNTASDAFGTVKGGLEGTVHQAKNGITHTVKKAEDAAGWVLNESETAWAYTVKIANQAWTFVIDTTEDIGHAFDTVWSAIKLGWNELVEWAGFIFDWEGIISVQRTIQSILTSTLSYYSTRLKNNDFNFNGLLNTLASHKASHPAPPDLLISSGRANAEASTTSSGQAVQSTPAKWLSHQIKYGGIMNISSSDSAAESSDHASEAAFLDKIKSFVDDMSVKLTELVRDLGKKFDPSALVSFSDILQSIADEILSDFIDALGRILQALLEGLGELIDLFERLGNAKIDIPIISFLYREITGQDLTMFSAVSLLIAIPASVITRLITHSSFPKFDVNPSNVAKVIGLDGTSSSSSVAHSTTTGSTTSPPPLTTESRKIEIKSLAAGSPMESKSTASQGPDPANQIQPIDTASAGAMMGLSVVEVGVGVADMIVQNKYQRTRPPMTLGSRLGKMIPNMLKAFGYVFTLPNDPTIPGYDRRIALGLIKMTGAFINFALARGDGGLMDDPFEKAMKTCDALVGLISFSIGSAIIHDELNAPTWRDYSKLRSGEQCAANVENFEAQIQDTLAYVYKASDPELALLFLAGRVFCLTARTGVLAAKFADAYQHENRAHLF